MNPTPPLNFRLSRAAALFTGAGMLCGCVELLAEQFEPHGRQSAETYWRQFSAESCPNHRTIDWR